MSTIIPNLLYTFGLSRVENGVGSIVVSVEPVAASIVGAVVYGESLGFDGVVGIVLICVSLIILNIGNELRGNTESVPRRDHNIINSKRGK